MRVFSQRLDDASRQALQELVGAPIQFVLSPSCDVEAGHAVLQAMSVSIPLGPRRFAVIESDWADTPEEQLDYHCLAVRMEDAPRSIAYAPDPPKHGGNYRFDHLSLHLGAASRVRAIEVLQASAQGETESVVYDAGLRITRDDGLQLALVRLESILGALRIGHTPADVARLSEGLAVRERFGA